MTHFLKELLKIPKKDYPGSESLFLHDWVSANYSRRDFLTIIQKDAVAWNHKTRKDANPKDLDSILSVNVQGLLNFF